jgi:hypothetical protein
MSYLIHAYVNKQSTCFELYQFIFRTLYHYTSYVVLIRIDKMSSPMFGIWYMVYGHCICCYVFTTFLWKVNYECLFLYVYSEICLHVAVLN